MTRDDKHLVQTDRAEPTAQPWAPGLAGCAGDTIDECLHEMEGAIATHIECLCEDNEAPLPPPTLSADG